MKGQAINIDWTIGLTLFVFTSLSSLFLIGTTDFGTGEGLRTTAADVQKDLISEASSVSMKNNLTAQTPNSIQNIPVDSDFYTEDVEDWASDKPVYINSSNNRFVSVIDGRESFSFTYFSENTTFQRDKSLIETGNNWMNNSKISVKTDNNGVNQIIWSDKSYFDQISLTGNANIRSEKLFADAFSGNLTIYNSSSEFIIKEKEINIVAGNYSNIYWHPDGEEDLNDGYSKEKITEGFSISNSSHTITFTGKMDAKVEKTGSNTDIQVNSSKIKVRLHDSGNSYGEDRIVNSADGVIFLGAEKKLELLSRKKLDRLENMTEEQFQEDLILEDIGYHINVTGNETYLSKGTEIPALTDAVVINRNSQLISENGTVEKVGIEVGVWR